MEKEKILSLDNVSVSIRNKQILKNIDLEVFAGDVLALDGANGCGKTSLLRLIYGETDGYSIESGKIWFCEMPENNLLKLSIKDTLKCRSLIGYVPQEDNYFGLNKVTVGDLIEDALKASNADDATREKASSYFDMIFANNSTCDINKRTCPSKLSGGEKRLLSIFLGLVCRTKSKLYIVDEPLNNLDFRRALLISDLLNLIRIDNPESAIIMVTHCKLITCVNRQRRISNGILDGEDSRYVSHHCMGEPDKNLFYNLRSTTTKK